MNIKGKKILVTGLTGQVGQPVALAYAKENEVWGAARFTDAKKRALLEQKGVRCVTVDLGGGDFSALPTDFDYVLNFAVAKGAEESFDDDIRNGAEAVGLLMNHTRKAKGFLHCSTTGVYQHAGHKEIKETDPLGDNHRVAMVTYSIAKICAEAVVRFAARNFNLPTVICRLNVPYGDNGGWPYYHLHDMMNDKPVYVHSEKPSMFRPIHEDDIVGTVPALLAAATVPARIVNWGGDTVVTVEEWCEYLGELTGKRPQFQYTDHTIASVLPDVSEMSKITGPLKTNWKDAMRHMVEVRHPEWLKKKSA